MSDYRDLYPGEDPVQENRAEDVTENAPETSPEQGRWVSDDENYRKPPYMREQEADRGYTYGENRESRTTYGGERESRPACSESRSRYSYDDSPRRREHYDSYESAGSREEQNKKSGRKVVLVIILIALLVGGLCAGACWSIGRLLSGADSGALEADDYRGGLEQILPGSAETEPAEEPGGAILENGAESVIPSTPEAEVSPDSPLITDIPDVVDMCMPSIVAITTTYVYENYNNYGYNPFYYYFGGSGNGGSSGGSNTYETTGAGSGIIIGDDGEELWIVTNNHVVTDSNEVKVNFNDGEIVNAYIKGTDTENDLAVVGVKLSDLKETTRSSIRSIQMGDSDSLRLGETVIAIGNALGIGQSVTSGIVSAVKREITTSQGVTFETIQTDAAINPGNSGGALLNSKGQLIGINVAKDVEEEVEGMGYAIPISNAKDIIQKLTTMKPREAVDESKYPYLGVQLKDLDSGYAEAYNLPEGILVYTVEAGGPAEKAGMLTQDFIVKFNGVAVKTYDDLKKELQYCEGGTTITVTIARLDNGTYVEKELSVTLGLKSDYVKEESAAASGSGSDSSGSNNNGYGQGGFGSFFGRRN